MLIKFSPSILAADFSILKEEVQKVEKAGAEMLHIDVMDGHFVPNLTFGPALVQCLRPHSGLFFDVHLMVDDPAGFVAPFAKAGADSITFHYEAVSDPRAALSAIRRAGKRAAVSIKPATPAEVLFELLPEVDMLLVMTVEPGFGGQPLIKDCLRKTALLRAEAVRRGLSIDIEVDGGITPETIGAAAESGANVFVAGSAVFHAKSPAAALQQLRGEAEKAVL